MDTGVLETLVFKHYETREVGVASLYGPVRKILARDQAVIELILDGEPVESDESKLAGHRSLEISLRTDILRTAFDVFVNLARNYHSGRDIGF